MSSHDQTTASGQSFDLDALRIPPNYAAALGVKKTLIKVPIRKPHKTEFFRVHPSEEWVFSVYLVEIGEAKDVYVATGSMAQVLGNLAKPAMMFLAVDRCGTPFLIPVYITQEDGKVNSWHESRRQALEHAKSKWVRMISNMSAAMYDVFEAQSCLSDPDWPECTPAELFRIAFRNILIADETHPEMRRLQGLA